MLKSSWLKHLYPVYRKSRETSSQGLSLELTNLDILSGNQIQGEKR